MKRLNWEVKFGIFLIILFLILNIIHYLIFKDIRHIFLWNITDFAFLPISVLFVTLIIDKLLEQKEKRSMFDKLNMLIGVFFSNVGTELLIYFSDWDLQLDKIKNSLVVTGNWSEKEFLNVSKQLMNYDYGVDMQKVDLEVLRNLLIQKQDFLLRLLENPNLLEHQSFTELLQAVFHLAEELSRRKHLKESPDTDIKHLSGDIKRAYVLLVRQWLNYIKYLKVNYPYLFSLAMRTNPFDESASPIVK